jgi:hypothetical protein
MDSVAWLTSSAIFAGVAVLLSGIGIRCYIRQPKQSGIVGFGYGLMAVALSAALAVICFLAFLDSLHHA